MPTDDEPDTRRDYLQTLERGITVLLAFSGARPELTLGDLAERTQLSKPTIRRIMLTLERLGYARVRDHRFSLTPKVLRLGNAYLSSVDLTPAAQPLMEAFTDRHGIGTSLAALDERDIVYLHRVQRHRITSINLAVGTRLPAHATSMGHVLLAALSDDSLGRWLRDGELPALTEHTLVTRDDLLARLALVRERGWDVVDQELETGRRSAAVPVHDASGTVVAALSLSMGTSECSVDDLVTTYVPLIQDLAHELTGRLGGKAYEPSSGGGRDA